MKGVAWSRFGGKRRGVNSLDEGMDLVAKERCCGIICCGESGGTELLMKDGETGEITRITLENGTFVFAPAQGE